jgi:death-on-curing protein
MIWRFLEVEQIKRIQSEIIKDYGGSHGLRDENLLASAVARARNKALYEEDSTVPTVGASMSFGLIKNHAFIDGNKRIGLAALILFLGAHGFELAATSSETEIAVQKTAASEITESQWTDWVERHSQRVK